MVIVNIFKMFSCTNYLLLNSAQIKSVSTWFQNFDLLVPLQVTAKLGFEENRWITARPYCSAPQFFDWFALFALFLFTNKKHTRVKINYFFLETCTMLPVTFYFHVSCYSTQHNYMCIDISDDGWNIKIWK